MKHLIILLAMVFFSGCIGWTETNSTLGDCSASMFYLKNKTNTSVLLSIDSSRYVLAPGHKFKKEIPANSHNICINAKCERIPFYPCIKYDFTPNLY